jgi:hypothetical protein
MQSTGTLWVYLWSMSRKTVLPLALLVLVVSSPVRAQASKRLWVLQPPDKLVEYDPLTFAAKQTVTVPAEALQAPQALGVNRAGQMLFAPTEYDTGFRSYEKRVWLWDGHAATLLDRGATHQLTPAGEHYAEVEAVPQPVLAADGAHLFWFVNRFDKVVEKNAGDIESSLDLSTRTTFRVWQTDLVGGHGKDIASFTFPPCQCGTAVCDETCPEAHFWSPAGGVADFFIITHWIPGQLQSDYQASFVYRQADGGWTATELPSAIEFLLDAAEHGDTRIEAVLDAGCCGWVNESNDRTLVTRNGKTNVLFDERARFNNPDYDISFFTPVARLSPGLDFVALEIACDPPAGNDIRLADQGKPDPAELARLQQAAANLPAVEILDPDAAETPRARLPHAHLVGWLSDREVLVVEDGTLAVFNVETGVQRKSAIRAPRPDYVFLR